MTIWSVLVHSHEAAAMLGEPEHIVQVRAFAKARSRAAFARALIAAGLVAGSEEQVSRYLRDYGGETQNERSIALATDEGAVFVEPSVHRRDVQPLPWPTALAKVGD